MFIKGLCVVAIITFMFVFHGFFSSPTNISEGDHIPHQKGICASVPDTVALLSYEYHDPATSALCNLSIDTEDTDSHIYFTAKYSAVSGCVYSEIITHYPNSKEVLSVFRSGNGVHKITAVCSSWASKIPYLLAEYKEYFTEY